MTKYLFIALMAVLTLNTGCNLIYKQNVQQGNAHEQEDLDQVELGMSKRQVAYLLGRLKTIGENGSTLLDNSMIVYGSSLADGHEHAERNLPLLLAGGGGGTIAAGKQVRFRSQTSMSQLHLALLNRLEVPVDRFADSESPLTLS